MALSRGRKDNSFLTNTRTVPFLLERDMKRKPSKTRTVICKICGQEFESNHSQAKYCPDKCRRLAWRAMWNKYSLKNKEKRSKSYSEWYKKNKERKIKQTKKYKKTERGKLSTKRASINARLKYPEKYQARQEVLKALRKGTLIKKPCEVCGKLKVQAHHEDYSKPLDVKWLCEDHHPKKTKQGRSNTRGITKP